MIALVLGFIIMSLGSLGIYAAGDREGQYKHHTFFHAAVPFIAATAYLAMATGLGSAAVDGREFYFARYADWSITTPILLTGLVLTALHEHQRNAGYLVSIIVLDVLMIVAGLLAGLSSDPTTTWIWYFWSCAAFAGVLFLLWSPLRALSNHYGGGMNGIFKRNAAIVTVLWLIYPVVFAIGPEGLGILNGLAVLWLILILDVTAKVVYGFIATSAFKSLGRSAKPATDRKDRSATA